MSHCEPKAKQSITVERETKMKITLPRVLLASAALAGGGAVLETGSWKANVLSGLGGWPTPRPVAIHTSATPGTTNNTAPKNPERARTFLAMPDGRYPN